MSQHTTPKVVSLLGGWLHFACHIHGVRWHIHVCWGTESSKWSQAQCPVMSMVDSISANHMMPIPSRVRPAVYPLPRNRPPVTAWPRGGAVFGSAAHQTCPCTAAAARSALYAQRRSMRLRRSQRTTGPSTRRVQDPLLLSVPPSAEPYPRLPQDCFRCKECNKRLQTDWCVDPTSDMLYCKTHFKGDSLAADDAPKAHSVATYILV